MASKGGHHRIHRRGESQRRDNQPDNQSLRLSRHASAKHSCGKSGSPENTAINAYTGIRKVYWSIHGTPQQANAKWMTVTSDQAYPEGQDAWKATILRPQCTPQMARGSIRFGKLSRVKAMLTAV